MQSEEPYQGLILLKERGAFGNADTGGAWLSSARADGPATPGKRIEEASDSFMHAPLGSGGYSSVAHIDGKVWHLDVGSSPPGAVVCSKGWAVRPLKRAHIDGKVWHLDVGSNAGGMLNTCKSDGKWCFQWRAVLSINMYGLGLSIMGDGLLIQEGSSVKATGKIAQIPVSEAYLGRVVNALAKPIDGRGAPSETGSRRKGFRSSAEKKDHTLMRLEELRFLATSTKDLDDDDAYWIKKQKRLIKNKMRNDLGDEDDEDE
ncbi:hypothetical protein Tco_0570423 [Tanacetum coccineum]